MQAILNLVAAAVPGLRPQNIAIVDSRGDLLARAGEPVGAVAQAATAEELQQATELRLDRAVEEMLERSLGPGHVRAEASVRMNFDRVNETDERYDPDGQVTRSTQTVTQNNKTTEANGAVTVQNNLPNANAGNTGAGSQENRQEETTNYEISRTVRTLIREQPQIERISLAVMVDGTETPVAGGKPVWKPRTAEELNRITALVKTAIGFDQKRGDQVEVVSMRFLNEAPPPAAEPPGLLGFRLEKADLMHLAQSGLFGLVGLLACCSCCGRWCCGSPRWPRQPRASAHCRRCGGAALSTGRRPPRWVGRARDGMPGAAAGPACPRRRCWKTKAW